jgi:hypothetical protein
MIDVLQFLQILKEYSTAGNAREISDKTCLRTSPCRKKLTIVHCHLQKLKQEASNTLHYVTYFYIVTSRSETQLAKRHRNIVFASESVRHPRPLNRNHAPITWNNQRCSFDLFIASHRVTPKSVATPNCDTICDSFFLFVHSMCCRAKKIITMTKGLLEIIYARNKTVVL